MVYYFSYGSNLLEERISNSCPNAKRVGLGIIRNYRVDFGNHFSHNWKGHVATIVPEKDSIVEGAIWKINDFELTRLDIQEGIHMNIYNKIFVPVLSTTNYNVYCYCYMLTDLPKKNNDNLPSFSYLYTIIEGAKQSGLSEQYIKHIKSFKNNNNITDLYYPNI